MEEQLIAAVCAQPDDDGPRLVFADWLEERGDLARAEFIRVQCQASCLPFWSPERRKLESQAETLFSANKKKWTKALKGTRVREYEFRRGFLEHIVLNGRTSAPYAEQIFAAFPTIQSVKFNELRKAFDEVLDAPWLKSVRQLNLTNNGLGIRRAVQLAETPGLRQLEALNLHSNKIGKDGMHAVLHSDALESLKHLELSGEDSKPEDAIQAFRGQRREQLESLSLGQMGWRGHRIPVMNQLFTQLTFPRLYFFASKEDQYSDTPASDESIQPMLDSEVYAQLTHLQIGGLSDSNLRLLASHPHSANLRSLAYFSPLYRTSWEERMQHGRHLNEDAIWSELKYLYLWTEFDEEDPLSLLPPKRFAELDALCWRNNRELMQHVRDELRVEVQGLDDFDDEFHDTFELVTKYAAFFATT